MLGDSATCYEGGWIFGNDQYVIAPSYSFYSLYDRGYSLYLCSHDVFPYQEPMIGPIINDYLFHPDAVWEIDTVSMTDFPTLVDNCLACEVSINLPGSHDRPAVYSTSSTILSTADVNDNVIYKANDRFSLISGFKTNPAYLFAVVMDGCN